MTHENKQTNIIPPSLSQGVILWQGRTLGIAVPAPLLVLDLLSWVRDVQVKFEDTALLCNSRKLASQRADYEADSAWLANWLSGPHIEPIVLHPALCCRQALPALQQVNRSNFEQYVGELCLRAEQIDPLVAFQFLFIVDDLTSILYTTKRLAFAAQHTGNEIRGEIVTEMELADYIRRARERDRKP